MACIQSPIINESTNTNIALSNRFMDQFGVYGNKTALVDAETGHSYTFAQVRELIGSVAEVLSTRFGFRKGHVLASFMENRPEYAMLFMGAVATGGTLTGINHQYTSEEVAKQLTDSNASIIVTTSGLSQTVDSALKLLPTGQIKHIFAYDGVENFNMTSANCEIVPFEELFSRPTTKLPTVTINPMEDVVFLPYSSGTTGTPKGVMLTHANLNCYFSLIPNGFTPFYTDRYLVILPFIHIAGFASMFSSVFSGATTYVMPRFEPISFMETIQREKITIMFVVPSVLVMLTKHPRVQSFDFSSIECILFGAAPAGQELITTVQKQFPCLKYLIQCYGMTESGVATCQPRLPPHRLDFNSIGLPMEYVKMRVVSIDGKNTILPPNVDGEICLKGVGNMKGYLNKPEQTRETIDSDGWLHSGDLGHYNEAGFIYVTDRLKELIKYKGHQVAPAELEDILLSHPGIREAAVTGIPDPVDPYIGELPTAFVILNSGYQPNAETALSIQKLVEDRTARYKHLRGGVRFMDEIPRTPSGKMQRRKLRDMVREERLKKSKL